MQTKSSQSPVEDKVIIQLIVFRVGEEEFGVPIDAVREIIKIGAITPIPNSPNFVKGIINVRGELVTAIDVKTRFSLPVIHHVEPKHIVVTKQDDSLFGLMVDEVIEVLRILKKDIKPPPTLINIINKKYVNGVVTHEGRLIILLDLTLVLSQDELLLISNITKKKKNKNKQNENTNTQRIIDESQTEQPKDDEGT